MEKKRITATEFKAAQKDGWEKQYRYKVGKRRFIWPHLPAQEKGYDRIDKHPKAAAMAGRIPFLNNGTVMSNSVSGEQTGQIL